MFRQTMKRGRRQPWNVFERCLLLLTHDLTWSVKRKPAESELLTFWKTTFLRPVMTTASCWLVWLRESKPECLRWCLVINLPLWKQKKIFFKCYSARVMRSHWKRSDEIHIVVVEVQTTCLDHIILQRCFLISVCVVVSNLWQLMHLPSLQCVTVGWSADEDSLTVREFLGRAKTKARSHMEANSRMEGK